eukprot:TRINITY_DN5632_c0_g1_i1.p1 TRINITY_DN5632_c0_g1~~TRINITY_DN5632_c0_g1_i1.p1  ORF type:complete len:251 (-),score=27.37 TRINITY_DN5632_c0_g1_i1:395-1147(-)
MTLSNGDFNPWIDIVPEPWVRVYQVSVFAISTILIVFITYRYYLVYNTDMDKIFLWLLIGVTYIAIMSLMVKNLDPFMTLYILSFPVYSILSLVSMCIITIGVSSFSLILAKITNRGTELDLSPFFKSAALYVLLLNIGFFFLAGIGEFLTFALQDLLFIAISMTLIGTILVFHIVLYGLNLIQLYVIEVEFVYTIPFCILMAGLLGLFVSSVLFFTLKTALMSVIFNSVLTISVFFTTIGITTALNVGE